MRFFRTNYWKTLEVIFVFLFLYTFIEHTFANADVRTIPTTTQHNVCDGILIDHYFEKSLISYHPVKHELLANYLCLNGKFPSGQAATTAEGEGTANGQGRGQGALAAAPSTNILDWTLKMSNSPNLQTFLSNQCQSSFAEKMVMQQLLNNADDAVKKSWFLCQEGEKQLACYNEEVSDGMFKLSMHIPESMNNLSVDISGDNYFFYTEPPSILSSGTTELFWTKNELEKNTEIKIGDLCQIDFSSPPILPAKQTQCATVFEHHYFIGRTLIIYNSHYPINNLANFNFSFTLTSAKVNPGCRLTLYRGVNLTGDHATLTNDIPSFVHLDRGQFQDSVQSLSCQCD